ncbi:hypothetical protein ACHQM5_017050 [Ranunculus cassubicifolius]
MPTEEMTASGDASASSSGNQVQPPLKRKRNLPGMPDPEAEVIALSPKTLMATNRFVCEICNKGFQRDQNLQLHRRGHNLPWKLRQRTTKEVRKRVYVCPEPTCVHHDPARALGDLTGIKKHFCRKHGEKKWKCDKCTKNYAVQSDWKAHLKTCGTKEYKCDCGTIFSRRDSFVTHRAFCEALTEESSRGLDIKPKEDVKHRKVDASSSPPRSSSIISAALQNSELIEDQVVALQQNPATDCVNGTSSRSGKITGAFGRVFGAPLDGGSLQPQTSALSDLVCSASATSTSTIEPPLLCLSSNNGFTLFGTSGQDGPQYARSSQPAMSATALLQKAAEMGAASSNPSSLLRGFGISVSSSSGQQETSNWNQDNVSGSGASLTNLMMGPSLLFGRKQATHDFLGLKIGLGGGISMDVGPPRLSSFRGGGDGDADGKQPSSIGEKAIQNSK